MRLIGLGARFFGVRSVLPIIRSMEAGAYGAYMAQDETAQALAPDEREHRLDDVANAARGDGTTTQDPSQAIAARERWHRTGGGGTLRASIFGVSDGLVSNTSLVMGFAGATSESSTIVLLAGVAGLLAGAFSMAAGEYVSMRAQRELFERQIELERAELESVPEEEARELSLIYQAKGLPKTEADQVAARLMENPEIALDTLVREELGLDPSELGSPWGASGGSFVAFAFGALVPVVPFFFGSAADCRNRGERRVERARLFGSGRGGFAVHRDAAPCYSGVRQVGLGAAAATVTFAIGSISALRPAFRRQHAEHVLVVLAERGRGQPDVRRRFTQAPGQAVDLHFAGERRDRLLTWLASRLVPRGCRLLSRCRCGCLRRCVAGPTARRRSHPRRRCARRPMRRLAAATAISESLAADSECEVEASGVAITTSEIAARRCELSRPTGSRVERAAVLVDVQTLEVGRATQRIAGGRLDLDHLRAEVAEQPPGVGRPAGRQVEHADAVAAPA